MADFFWGGRLPSFSLVVCGLLFCSRLVGWERCLRGIVARLFRSSKQLAFLEDARSSVVPDLLYSNVSPLDNRPEKGPAVGTASRVKPVSSECFTNDRQHLYLMSCGSGTMSVTSLDVSSQAGREGKKVNFIQAPMCGTGGPGATVFPASTVASSALSSSGPSSLASCLPSSTQDVSRKTCGGQASKVEEGCSSFLQAVDGEIPRPTSAPPHLEKFSASTLFAFPPSGSTVNRLIDIRCDELYQEFYRYECSAGAGAFTVDGSSARVHLSTVTCLFRLTRAWA